MIQYNEIMVKYIKDVVLHFHDSYTYVLRIPNMICHRIPHFGNAPFPYHLGMSAKICTPENCNLYIDCIKFFDDYDYRSQTQSCLP